MNHTQLKKHILFTEHSSVLEICNPLFDINITGFIYMRQFQDGSFIDLSTKLDWSEFFLNKFLKGEYCAHTIKNHMFMHKDINLWMSDPDNLVWREGKQFFGYGNGISICFTHANYNDVFCFYTDIDNHAINELYIKNYQKLKLFCQYFIGKADKLIKKGLSNKLHSPAKYLTEATNPSDTAIIHNQLSNKLIQGTPFKLLTKRELSTINLIMNGHTAQQAADALFISKRTVETHLCNAKKKLSCTSLSQLSYLVTKYLVE